ncbi:aspartate aminotransferase family protein [Vogesella oryzae]|uniref:aspartate aminotransferase family protein n=1 Tax=Vogesella oryzae TaxID=1735285 RepID=UPI0015844345|nr:aspartate aminotransferase family protein [Vogesella oryzae]
MSVVANDIACHLHGYTNAARHEDIGPMVIERGEGVYVYDQAGRRYLEAMSGLFSVALGFSEPRLVAAATEQLNRLPYYHVFTHKTHGPVAALAQKLIDIAPVPMSKVFFANSGSEANDTAIKLIWYYHNARGLPQKKKIIARLGAYHGVTVASGSLTGLPYNHRGFDLPLAGILHAACPHFYRYGREGESEDEFSTRLLQELEQQILHEGADTIAAFFGEPLMGSGGIIPPPRGYWQGVQALCQRYDILLVADEVICGFGRTGQMFGCQTYGIRPDMMSLSKQLSSSYMPISALLLNDKVYRVIRDYSGEIGTLGHGLTAGGHPVAAAVALENINIIEERNLVAQAAQLGDYLHSQLQRFADHPLVGEIRGEGLIAAIELVADKAAKQPFSPPGKAGSYFNSRCQAHGMIVRNGGDNIILCPPLIVTREHIDFIVDVLARALAETADWLAHA